MPIEPVVKFIQSHFTDGLVLVIGSGLSAAEGLPGMPLLAQYLLDSAGELDAISASRWKAIAETLYAGAGLEAALLKHAPTDQLEAWIVRKTCNLLLPKENQVLSEVIRGGRTLRLTRFLSKLIKFPDGLPILTPNYDRLIEVACEMADYHVDTTAIGNYAGVFDHVRSCMASCKGITRRGKFPVLDHFPRAIVLKPHGSFDWYRHGAAAIRSSIELDADRLIITPGLNKYKAGYSSPFDKHRELANNHINQSVRLLIVGYGFNDDHLQTHLVSRIRGGTPTLILTRSANDYTRQLVKDSPNCWCLSKPDSGDGTVVLSRTMNIEQGGANLWDLGTLAEELLA